MVINVAVGLTAFLPLYPYLSGNTHTARSAPQKPAEWPRVGLDRGQTASASQDSVRPVPKVFRYDRFVLALVYFSGIAEVSVVKRILQNEGHSRNMDVVFVFGLDTCLFQNLGEIFKTDSSRRVKLKDFFDEFCVLAVNDNCFGAWVIYISERSKAGIDTLPHFLPKSASGVRAQLADILIRHTKLDGHHKHVVVLIVASIVRLYVRDYALLEKPLYLSAVYGVASQAVNLPTDNPLCLAPLYAFEHIVKDGASGFLRGAFFNKLLRDVEIFALGDVSQFGELAFYGEDLFILNVGTFPGVEKVWGH